LEEHLEIMDIVAQLKQADHLRDKQQKYDEAIQIYMSIVDSDPLCV
jgi:tetratricopeptide (TPR) repeat protein